ncbi:MAG: modification methylase [Nitrospirae bacterium CG_4_10_14_3_um_filter_44_29]|nr:site-specific DNA-methyltransferase [Nitrospirota bacterium]OIO32080.1 MAG: modification methylase [Nitrospirae bacterium CG1_02_44_142]PIP70646.1 MAG: modification methylase [Nitrospirae bacterium CG22_combo_CG10-13_8_21_14_all_44_11]PIV39991.1 MAG: modification methylase [Nitrospirae bacterium CG02_land_8_20_14_3_00_44_33]PIV67426.1 MAG: modification methylase [Nitrospirae bacterium CG01_land_8_20_14_3_00_44_22]PIW89186.1 MAG: modification methylase [Nitrospirae bacterium CG_4_8_14_3_um_f
MGYKIIYGDCTKELEHKKLSRIDFFKTIDLTFLDPPFNQGKEYAEHDDNLPDKVYWDWMRNICRKVYELTSQGGAIYFMQREKNAEQVLWCLRESGWNLQNLIIWKKKTSAVPCSNKFGKHYQIIAFAIKGKKPRVFNRLRINPPLPAEYKYEREDGMYVTDVWEDIRELTAGYFAGDEAIRKSTGERFHKQQSPIQLLLRIILSSSNPNDTILDPFAGTGTTLVAVEQLNRNSIGIEKDTKNVKLIEKRLKFIRESDRIEKFYKDYIYTENLDLVWYGKNIEKELMQQYKYKNKQLSLMIAEKRRAYK